MTFSDRADLSDVRTKINRAIDRVVDVRDFGAAGDGTTDDTAAIQAAIDTVTTQTAPVTKLVFGTGKTYFVTDQLECPFSIHIDGQGSRITTALSDANKSLLVIGQSGTKTYRHTIENLTISHPIGTSLSAGLELLNAGLVTVRNVYIAQFAKQILGGADAVDPFLGWISIEQCYLQGGQYGIYAPGVAVNVFGLRNSRILSPTAHGILVDEATSVEICGNDFSFCGAGASEVSNAGSVVVRGNYTEKCGPGTEANTAEIFKFDTCENVDFSGANSVMGAHDTWRDRTHAYRGAAFYGCDYVKVENNSFSYFMDVPIFFDADTGENCEVGANRYTINFANYHGCPVRDLSGFVKRPGDSQPDRPKTINYVENVIGAPSEVATNWTHGAQVTAVRNGEASAPPETVETSADTIQYVAGGTDKVSSYTTAAVTANDFNLMFWAKLISVTATSPLSGLASVKWRVLDGVTTLLEKNVSMSPHWQFFKLPFNDANATSHTLAVYAQPSDLTYMEFKWAIAGVQISRKGAPYLNSHLFPNTTIGRSIDGEFGIFPRSFLNGADVFKQSIAGAAPTTGTHVRGDIVWNIVPAASGYIGWVCTASGTPGTWKGFGAIQA